MLLVPVSGFSGLSHENAVDREIFSEGLQVSAKLLSKNSQSVGGGALLKFLKWMDGSNKVVKDMSMQLVFSEPITAKGGGSEKDLCAKMLTRSEGFKSELSKKLLYLVVASRLDPGNVKGKKMLEAMKDMSYDLSLRSLLKQAARPRMVDLAKIAAESAESDRLNAIEEKKSKANYKDEGKLPKAEVEKLLDLIKYKNFSCSEASIFDAVNRLTHKLYWRGVQFTVSGKRLSYIKTSVAPNEAIFYFGPLWQPKSEEFSMKDKTIREILAHMKLKLDLEYTVKDGEVAIHDGELKGVSDVPEDGLVSSDLRVAMKGHDIKTTKKYRGKVVKMNGIVTGVGTHNHDTIYLSLDGGLTRLHISYLNLNSAVFKRLKKRVEAWKKSGGMKKYREAARDADDADTEIRREDLVSPNMYIVFQATCKGMDRDRLVFEDPSFAYIDAKDEFITKEKKSKVK